MSEDGGVPPERFRAAMARWASGVSVVTAREHGTDTGLTVNALLSVSLRPPTLLVSLTHDADSTPVILRTRRFAVSILAADQRALSERFALAVPSVEKFVGVAVHRRADGPPRLDGTLGTFECAVESTLDVLDHVLIVGRVVDLEGDGEGLPLLFFRSQYGEPAGEGALRLPRGRR